MAETTVTVTCPSCGVSKQVPTEKIPPSAVNATCRACGHVFPIAGKVTLAPEIPPVGDLRFEDLPLTARAKAERPSRPFAEPSRSSFVTAVAWVFIALCGFGTFISILQNVMVNTVMPVGEMQKATAPGTPEMPAFFRFMMGNVRLFFASFLVVSASMLGAAIGLLKRKNWARVLFITILSLGILWNIGGLVLQFYIMQDFPKPAGAPPEFAATFSTMRTVMMVFSALTSVGFSALFGWIIKRLASEKIRREFS